MPSQYVPGREPPSVWDRILANPFSVALSTVLLTLGLLIITSTLAPIEVSRTLAAAHPGITALIGAMLTTGATINLFGTLNPRIKMSRLKTMLVESIGALLIVSGALSFGVGIVLSGNRLGYASALIILGLSAGYGLRSWAITKSDKRIREKIAAELNGGVTTWPTSTGRQSSSAYSAAADQ